MKQKQICALVHKSKSEVQNALTHIKNKREAVVDNDSAYFIVGDKENKGFIIYNNDIGRVEVSLDTGNWGGDTVLLLEKQYNREELFSLSTFLAWKTIVWAFHIISFASLVYFGITENTFNNTTLGIWIASMPCIVINIILTKICDKTDKIKHVAKLLEDKLNNN